MKKMESSLQKNQSQEIVSNFLNHLNLINYNQRNILMCIAKVQSTKKYLFVPDKKTRNISLMISHIFIIIH